MLAGEALAVHDVELDARTGGEGPPLLFLHGEDGLIWSTPVLEALAKDFRVTAPHHPGWGESTRPAHILETKDVAAVYCEYLENQDQPVLIVGCSFGAWVAAEIALRCRVPIAGLVMVAPIGIKLGGREDREFLDIWMTGFAELPGQLYGDPAAAPDLTGLADEDYFYLAVAGEGTARYCWRPYMHDPRLRPWLRRIEAPALMVAGEEDRLVLREDYFERYAELIGSGADLQMLAGVGHRVEEERPTELAELVGRFARQAAGDPVTCSGERG